MNLQVDVDRVAHAFDMVRSELLGERTVAGHWVGELGSSPSATAAAINALVIAHDSGADELVLGAPIINLDPEHVLRCDLSELLMECVHWLAERQNADGGWSDVESGRSSVEATLLALSAFRVTCVPAKYEELTERADDFLEAQGGAASLRKRFGGDKTFTAPILASAAIAGLMPWRQVPALPFELACVPRKWQARLRLPVASFALPVLIAVGLAKFHHDPPRNPLRRLIRMAARKRSLVVLEQLQAEDGSFLESTLITSTVVMCISNIGLEDHPIVQRGVEFLLTSVRSNGTWAADVNLATANTARAMLALAHVQAHHESSLGSAAWTDTTRAEDTLVEPLNHLPALTAEADGEKLDENCLDWLLEQQRLTTVPHNGSESGGWSWTELTGGLVIADDTALVLLALAASRDRYPRLKQHRLQLAARQGIEWLLATQNDDKGWSALCCGGGVASFDNSAADVTAHAVRALAVWQRMWNGDRAAAELQPRIRSAIERGVEFLEHAQRNDGSFVPVGLGNQYHAEGHNLVYGTAAVLAMCAELGTLDSEIAQRAARWLLGVQHVNGGWGPPRNSPATSASNVYRSNLSRAEDALASLSSSEETALAVGALLPLAASNQLYARAVQNGLKWLVDAVEQGRLRQPAAIGLRFGKLWHTERLFPLVFAAGALGQATRQLSPERPLVAPMA